jgi:hypothetical protein
LGILIGKGVFCLFLWKPFGRVLKLEVVDCPSLFYAPGTPFALCFIAWYILCTFVNIGSIKHLKEPSFIAIEDLF